MAEPFAAQLRKHRARMCWTQADLADRVRVTAMVVAQWEQGLSEPKWSTLVDLADVFGVSGEPLRAPAAPADLKTPRAGDADGQQVAGAKRGQKGKGK